MELLQLDGYTVDYTDPQPGTCNHAKQPALAGVLRFLISDKQKKSGSNVT